MQKVIRLLAIVATALVFFSLFLLLVSIPLQRPIAREFLGYPAFIASRLPQFPVVPFVMGLLRMLCIGLLIACCGNKRGGIWVELLVIAALVLVLPFLNTIATNAANIFASRYSGSDANVANYVVSLLSSYCLIPANLGTALAYITCGMSIAFKVMYKKQKAEQ